MNLLRIVLTICAVTISIAGCAGEQAAWPKLEPVKDFSLGSAKFTPFKKRPTAVQVYKATTRLHRSFKTVMLSSRNRGGVIIRDSKGKAKGIRWLKRIESYELRVSLPDRETFSYSYVKDGKFMDGYVVVRTAPDRLIDYIVQANIYTVSTGDNWTPSAAEWMGEEYPRNYVSQMWEQVLGGTEVYVLQMRVPAYRDKHRRYPTQIARWYLGKKDLLPRRHESECVNDFYREDYTGFVANTKLPDNMFPTKPPKGAKPMGSD